ncbi:MAG: TonB-dependent receptor [Woeseia sp.]
MNRSTTYRGILCIGFLSSAMVAAPYPVHAQVSEFGAEGGQLLEEVVVTAQRREQSMMEVPISLEAWSGVEIREQGFRTMDDLSAFSPSITIDDRTQDQDIAIRGIGTTGNNLTLEQAAPTFVDGIHYSRSSMIKGAFLDLERVEVLRGPQPVFFGQNATAGAFSLTTRKPTPEWEGNLLGEVGQFGRYSLEGGVGGPLTDTLGIRVAGKWDTLDGYMEDIITGDDFPQREDMAGRVTLQWNPNSQLQTTLQLGYSDTERGADGSAVCTTPGAPRSGEEPNEGDWWLPGSTTFQNDIVFTPPDSDCFTKKGISEGLPPFYAPPTDLRQDDADAGILDIREVARLVMGDDFASLAATDEFETSTSYLELRYLLDNGIELTSLTGLLDYDRAYFRDNDGAPFITNQQTRAEDMTSFSQEFRVASPVGEPIEWMIGAYYQNEDLKLHSDTIRANIRRPRRRNDIWQESEWLSAFATVTFNFLEDRASIDVGGRYSQVKKDVSIEGFGATWIFDVDPTSGTPGGGCVDGVNADFCFEDDEDVIALGNGQWTHAWRLDLVPDVWDGMAPIGITELDPSIRRRSGPYRESLKETHFDPQITIRYRPTENLSLYAKWAEAFKAGGFDTGQSSVPRLEEFRFRPEFAQNAELGLKGSFWNGRARGGVTLFNFEVKDLQIATTSLEQGSVSTNAGKQRVRGAEFDLAVAVTDHLRATLVGALMDGEMLQFEAAGCTDAEDEAGLCRTEEDSIALVGDDSLEGTIDRSGEQAPRTPDWKIILGLTYSAPFMDRFTLFANTKAMFSDGYIDDVENFRKVTMWDQHHDMNVSVGLGDVDGRWKLSLYGRNLFEARPEYHPEFDVFPSGRVSKNLSMKNFRSYGLQFQYELF